MSNEIFRAEIRPHIGKPTVVFGTLSDLAVGAYDAWVTRANVSTEERLDALGVDTSSLPVLVLDGDGEPTEESQWQRDQAADALFDQVIVSEEGMRAYLSDDKQPARLDAGLITDSDLHMVPTRSLRAALPYPVAGVRWDNGMVECLHHLDDIDSDNLRSPEGSLICDSSVQEVQRDCVRCREEEFGENEEES